MDMLPPARYDHQPTIKVEDHVLTSDAVNRICWEKKTTGWDGRPPPANYHFLGCAHLAGGRCEVWRIDDGMIRRHEYAHCNGWPSNHPATFVVASPKPVAPVPVDARPAAPLYGVRIGVNAPLAPWPIVMKNDMPVILPERGYLIQATRPAESAK